MIVLLRLRLWECSPSWDFVVVGLFDDGGGPWAFWRVLIWARSWSFRHFNSSRSRAAFSRSCAACSRSRSNRICCFIISSFMSANIWRSWLSYVDGGWMSSAAPYEGAKIVSSTMRLRLRLLRGWYPQWWQWICFCRWSRHRWSATFSGSWLVWEAFWVWVWQGRDLTVKT